MWPRSRTARLILWSALIAGLGCRVYVMFTDDGIYWPDEIHQSLEPAHRLVFGYGLIAWEFSEGARNWAFPGLIAGLMGATAGLGGDSPHIYLPVIRLVFVAMSLGVALGSTGSPGSGAHPRKPRLPARRPGPWRRPPSTLRTAP